MKNYFDEKTKINKIEVKCRIVDNTHKHKGHKFYSPNKFHLRLKLNLCI